MSTICREAEQFASGILERFSVSAMFRCPLNYAFPITGLIRPHKRLWRKGNSSGIKGKLGVFFFYIGEREKKKKCGVSEG